MTQEQFDAGVRHMLADVFARAYVWRVLTECGVFETNIHRVGMQAADLAHHFGAREFGMRIMNDALRAAPELYITMVKENVTRTPPKQEDSHDGE
ncbi:MAG: hypothetical protein HQM01_08225 [Magnetococcales bacterium]|nr:hypothetical protein [Magnetococcales bacterium]